MQLIVYYVVFMIAGDIAAYLIGLVTEREFGSHVSLIVFLTLYFLFLWIAWLLAVWFTAPKDVHRPGTGAPGVRLPCPPALRLKLTEKSVPPVGRFSTVTIAAWASAIRWTI